MNSMVSLGERFFAQVKKLDGIALFIARLTVGVLFVSTGWGKVHNLDKVTAFFGDLGIPMPALNALVASYTELVCGALLVVGCASRLASLPLVVTMGVAILTAKRDDVHGLADLFGLVEWTYLVLLLVIAVVGPGALSADAWIARRLRAASVDGDRPRTEGADGARRSPAYGRQDV